MKNREQIMHEAAKNKMNGLLERRCIENIPFAAGEKKSAERESQATTQTL
jgi:hypothetical protein